VVSYQCNSFSPLSWQSAFLEGGVPFSLQGSPAISPPNPGPPLRFAFGGSLPFVSLFLKMAGQPFFFGGTPFLKTIPLRHVFSFPVGPIPRPPRRGNAHPSAKTPALPTKPLSNSWSDRAPPTSPFVVFPLGRVTQPPSFGRSSVIGPALFPIFDL